MKKFFNEFKEFISKGNVMDMAIGVIIATAFGKGMESTGIIIIIHLQISVILFHDFFNTLDSEAMSAFV